MAAKSRRVLENIMKYFALDYNYGFMFFKYPKRFAFHVCRKPNVPLLTAAGHERIDFNDHISICGVEGKQKTTYYGPCFFVDDYKGTFAPARNIKLDEFMFLSLDEASDALCCSSDKLAQLVVNDLRRHFNAYPSTRKTLVLRSIGVVDDEWHHEVPYRRLFTSWEELMMVTDLHAYL